MMTVEDQVEDAVKRYLIHSCFDIGLSELRRFHVVNSVGINPIFITFVRIDLLLVASLKHFNILYLGREYICRGQNH